MLELKGRIGNDSALFCSSYDDEIVIIHKELLSYPYSSKIDRIPWMGLFYFYRFEFEEVNKA